MGQQKANKVFTMGTPYYWESEFEYRGQYYTVTYSSGFSSFKQTPAYIQHREAQARIDEKLDKKLDQKLEENNKKLEAVFEQKLEAAFEQKLTPIYQRMDHLEYQIKQTEYNLRNEIRRTEKLLLNEIERVHIILDQHINDPRMHPCLT